MKYRKMKYRKTPYCYRPEIFPADGRVVLGGQCPPIPQQRQTDLEFALDYVRRQSISGYRAMRGPKHREN